MEFDELSNRVIGSAIEVHRERGPGVLESTYEQCLAHELKLRLIPLTPTIAYRSATLAQPFHGDSGDQTIVATARGGCRDYYEGLAPPEILPC